MNLRIGDLIKIKRTWTHTPTFYVQGIILDVRTTKWDPNYRIVTILKNCGEISREPVSVDVDSKNVEILSRF